MDDQEIMSGQMFTANRKLRELEARVEELERLVRALIESHGL